MLGQYTPCDGASGERRGQDRMKVASEKVPVYGRAGRVVPSGLNFEPVPDSNAVALLRCHSVQRCRERRPICVVVTLNPKRENPQPRKQVPRTLRDRRVGRWGSQSQLDHVQELRVSTSDWRGPASVDVERRMERVRVGVRASDFAHPRELIALARTSGSCDGDPMSPTIMSRELGQQGSYEVNSGLVASNPVRRRPAGNGQRADDSSA